MRARSCSSIGEPECPTKSPPSDQQARKTLPRVFIYVDEAAGQRLGVGLALSFDLLTGDRVAHPA